MLISFTTGMFFYFFLGLGSSIIGAIPLGATNVVVINTTLKTTITEAKKILYPAAFGEVILVVVALYRSMPLKDFIQNNSYLPVYTIYNVVNWRNTFPQ
ncbi:hypothetical protein [Winogradskyella aurantiaca]|uniref:hypothetical protein n=1 Tax=Winogradskyella aurantiaca TaxID=2219558 RepID=UPI001300A806|nr:hypothetical protein [Winogradskyella aurantiaca]